MQLTQPIAILRSEVSAQDTTHCVWLRQQHNQLLQILPHGVPAHVERGGGAGEVLSVFLEHAADVEARRVLKPVGRRARVGEVPVEQPRVHLLVLAHERGEVVLLQRRRAFEEIDELAHVPRIVVVRERGELRGVERAVAVPLPPPGVRDGGDVLLVLAQGRDAQLDDVEPRVEVFAEPPLADARGQVAPAPGSQGGGFSAGTETASISSSIPCV